MHRWRLEQAEGPGGSQQLGAQSAAVLQLQNASEPGGWAPTAPGGAASEQTSGSPTSTRTPGLTAAGAAGATTCLGAFGAGALQATMVSPPSKRIVTASKASSDLRPLL